MHQIIVPIFIISMVAIGAYAIGYAAGVSYGKRGRQLKYIGADKLIKGVRHFSGNKNQKA
jgi:hypothetical protein